MTSSIQVLQVVGQELVVIPLFEGLDRVFSSSREEQQNILPQTL